jgi:hypothetical protein
MKITKDGSLHFVILLLLGSLASAQEASQARNKQPRSLEDYHLCTLKEIAALKPDANSFRDKQERLVVTADDLPCRVRVAYAGSTRPIPRLKKEVIHEWARLYAGSIEHYTEPHQSEMLFVEDGVTYWLAVPKDSPLLSKQSFKIGESLDLYLIRLGASIVGNKYDWTLLVEKFRKTDTAQADESRPSLNYLGKYMPKVGRKITVEGVLDSAKLGLVVTFDAGVIYIYPTQPAGTSKMNAFESRKGQIVRVRGTLRYARGSPAPAAGELSIPEHFFFDADEARVITVRARHR